MDIRNFTGQTIRLGEFPSCLDINSLDGYHSSDGLMATFHGYKMNDDQHFIQIRKRKDTKDGFIVFVFRWEEQVNNLPDYIGEVVFDSRDKEII